MSVFRLVLPKVFNFTKQGNISLINNQLSNNTRQLSLNLTRNCANTENPVEEKKIDPAIDRTKIIPVEISIKYLLSEAYKNTYGNHLVWEQYRRNHKGMLPPRKTRKTCIRKGLISTGNPCPICRDEFLVLDHRNLDLLKQFISPQTGQVKFYCTHFIIYS